MLVSCICPTRNRRDFLPGAIACFLAQDWPDRELVIVDDGISVADLIPAAERIRYFHSRTRRNIGQKRNIACSRAEGSIICHFDDDDWYSPCRITDQVNRLIATGAPVTGYNEIVFASDELQRAWRYLGEPLYAVGTSLCYLHSYWEQHPFPDLEKGEDNAFVKTAPKIAVSDGCGQIVARLHGGNTCQRMKSLLSKRWTGTAGESWQEVEYESLANIGYRVAVAA
jgi:glycosyltransferase involved in cell wall biosynthesis